MRVCVCLCVNGWPENAWLTKGEERDFFFMDLHFSERKHRLGHFL